jgi:hypothetical protein
LNDRERAPPIWRRFSRQGRRNGKRRVHKLRNAPSPIGNAHGLRWRRAEGFVDAVSIGVQI